MAESRDNFITHGLSGRLGSLIVFRQWFGRTIVGKRPRKSETVTAAQQGVRDKFQLAAAYATAAIKNTTTKDLYKTRTSPGQSAFNLALSDFIVAPEIGEIDISGYNGHAGDMIKVPVTDDFMVKTVDVAIHKADGSLLEQGTATADPDGLHWLYTATQANAAPAGCKVSVTAKDLPANMTVKDKIVV